MTKLEPTQEKDLLLAIARLEQIEDDVKETLENLRNIKESSHLKIGVDLTPGGKIKKKMTNVIRLVCRVGSIRFTNRATVSLGDIFDAQTEDEARELVNKGYAEILSVREERTMKDEEDDYITFEKWFEENEAMFSHAQYSDKDIGYAAWLEGGKHENRED